MLISGGIYKKKESNNDFLKYIVIIESNSLETYYHEIWIPNQNNVFVSNKEVQIFLKFDLLEYSKYYKQHFYLCKTNVVEEDFIDGYLGKIKTDQLKQLKEIVDNIEFD